MTSIKTRNGIGETSRVRILVSDPDLYVAAIGDDDKIIIKTGPRTDVGSLVPGNYQVATSGNGYCVWEKKQATTDE